MLIFDGDYPMAYSALELNRDLTLPVEAVRRADPGSGNLVLATLPEMRRGGIAGALVKVVARIEREGSPLWGYRSGDLAHAAARGHLAFYQVLADRGEIRILETRSEFSRHMEEWTDAAETAGRAVGVVLGMEGADPILWPEQLSLWWDWGLRVVSLTHYGPSSYAHGTGCPGGLFPPARPLLAEMERTGMILDLTHISDEGFWQSLELFQGPVLASHQNCRALVPGERQFSDRQLRAVIERGGVIGVSLDTWMLHRTQRLDWATRGMGRARPFAREEVTLEDAADHIEHICELAGSTLHAAIGGDTDGQGGLAGAPGGIDTVADYPKIAETLVRRNWKPEDIANVMYANWQRFFERCLPE